ncbi:MAG: hypothetical protein SGCHY_005162 [Lobulomycetales sp.]
MIEPLINQRNVNLVNNGALCGFHVERSTAQPLHQNAVFPSSDWEAVRRNESTSSKFTERPPAPQSLVDGTEKMKRKCEILRRFQQKIGARVRELEESKKQATRAIQEQPKAQAPLRNRHRHPNPLLEKNLSQADLPLEALPQERSYFVHPEEKFDLVDVYFKDRHEKNIGETLKSSKEEKDLVLLCAISLVAENILQIRVDR